jgi:hypothetical protein
MYNVDSEVCALNGYVNNAHTRLTVAAGAADRFLIFVMIILNFVIRTDEMALDGVNRTGVFEDSIPPYCVG